MYFSCFFLYCLCIYLFSYISCAVQPWMPWLPLPLHYVDLQILLVFCCLFHFFCLMWKWVYFFTWIGTKYWNTVLIVVCGRTDTTTLKCCWVIIWSTCIVLSSSWVTHMSMSLNGYTLCRCYFNNQNFALHMMWYNYFCYMKSFWYLVMMSNLT